MTKERPFEDDYRNFPSEYEKLALLRYNQYDRFNDDGDENMPKYPEALVQLPWLFNYEKTPEGFDFWKAVQDASDETELPPIPEESLNELRKYEEENYFNYLKLRL